MTIEEFKAKIVDINNAVKANTEQADKAFAEITTAIQKLREAIMNGSVVDLDDVEAELHHLEITVNEQMATIQRIDDIVPDQVEL